MGTRTVAKVFLIIGAVLAFIYAFFILLGGIAMLVLTSPNMAEFIKKALEDGTVNTSFTGTIDEQVKQIQDLFLIIGSFFIGLSVVEIVNGIIASLASKKNSKGLFITNLIFGIIFGTFFNFIGGVAGLVSSNDSSSSSSSSYSYSSFSNGSSSDGLASSNDGEMITDKLDSGDDKGKRL